VRRLPYPKAGDPAAALDLCPAAQLAQELVAGLDSAPRAGVPLRRQRQTQS